MLCKRVGTVCSVCFQKRMSNLNWDTFIWLFEMYEMLPIAVKKAEVDFKS